MRIATWNVNSVKARLPNVTTWLDKAKPDVVLLQEIKCETANFPTLEFQALGYTAHALGQKSYNGVAILSRHPIKDVLEHLPGDTDDPQARYLEATIKGIRVASIYLPNGNPLSGVIPDKQASALAEASADPESSLHLVREAHLQNNFSEKYLYKLAWMKRLQARAAELLQGEKPVVLGGDYNIIPEDIDVYDPKAWEGDALFHPTSRAAWRAITQLGYTEAFRALNPNKTQAYTFWDYQAGAWQRDNGIRIDHFLLSPEATDRLVSCTIDREPRGAEKASDHTPVVVEVKI